MKKTLLAVAVAAALPAVAFAQTNVTLSGNIKAGISSSKFSNGADGTNGSINGVGDGSSKFIISGSEDLGGGLRAVFQWDNRLRPDDNGLNASSGMGNELAGGNSFVGLAGSFGQVRLGRIDQYYGLGIDGHAGAATALTASSISILSYLNGTAAGAPATRTQNLLRWDSANMSGLTLGVGYSFAYAGAEGTASSITPAAAALGNGQKGSAIALDANYVAGPLSAGVAYFDGKNEAKTTGTKGLRGAVKYNFGAFDVGLTIDQSKNTAVSGNVEDKRTAFSIPVSAKLGPGTAMFTYTVAGDVKGTNANSNTGAKFITVGYDYPLSKRTSLGVSYAVLNNESAAKYGMFTASALHNMPTAGVGQDTKQLWIGVNHKY